jgi:hypothetical protein
VFSLALAVTLFAALPAGAGARRAPAPSFSNCHDHAAAVEVTRAQAQSYLPEGFTPYNGAADQGEVVHLYVDTTVCGGTEPTLKMVKTYLAVHPPAELDGQATGEYFVLDAGASGAIGDRLRKQLCLGSFLDEAEIQLTPVDDSLETGPAGATATVESPSVSATIAVAGARVDSDGLVKYRWFYEREDEGLDYFDTIYVIDGLAMGSGEVVFGQPYRDLPLAAPALDLYRFIGTTFYPSPSCRAARSR